MRPNKYLERFPFWSNRERALDSLFGRAFPRDASRPDQAATSICGRWCDRRSAQVRRAAQLVYGGDAADATNPPARLPLLGAVPLSQTLGTEKAGHLASNHCVSGTNTVPTMPLRCPSRNLAY